MAMAVCKECKNPVSTTAKACPHCGAKPPRRVGLLGWLFVIFIFAPMVWIMASPAPETVSAAAPAVSPEEAARRAAESAADKARSIRAAAGAVAIKKAARNPDSVVLESAFHTVDGAVCYRYRAQNGFGGMNRAEAVLRKNDRMVGSGEAGFEAAWNAECAGKDGYQYAKSAGL